MADSHNQDWKVFSDDENSKNVPLWKALAKFSSEDLDEGLRINTDIIKRERTKILRYYNIVSLLGIGCRTLFCLNLLIILGAAATARWEALGPLILAALAMSVVCLAEHALRQFHQYGRKPPMAPLPLLHESHPHFDEFLGYLQSAKGPRAYYFTRFRKKRKLLGRRQFFGNHRYFLFSEDKMHRSMVMRYSSILPTPADIFLHHDDVEKLIAANTQKPKLYQAAEKCFYTDSAISMIVDDRSIE